MSGVRVGAVVAGVVISGLLTVAGARAQLVGDSRALFVTSSIKGCVTGAERQKLPVAPATMEAYCTCMANRQAEMTTEADLAHYASRHELSEDYQQRITALAPACKKEIGLNK